MDLKYVRFDVGHYLYVCHRNTLQKFENSVLAKYIAPEFDKRKSGDDYIVIDRDGKHFGTILNFMRDQTSLDLSQWKDHDLTDLMREADYYCLTELIELCEHEFVLREKDTKSDITKHQYKIPPNYKIEIVLGVLVGRELLRSSKKPTIVISYRNTRRYNIDSWIEELVRFCDHQKFHVYSFADRGHTEILADSKLTLKDFFVALYEPQDECFTVWVSAPSFDKFRARRPHYKWKLFKFWHLLQKQYETLE